MKGEKSKYVSLRINILGKVRKRDRDQMKHFVGGVTGKT